MSNMPDNFDFERCAGHLLRQVRDIGYVVKEFRVNGTVEYHAVRLPDGDDVQVARCNDGDGPESTYRAACLLARAVGIELDDG